MCANHVKPTWDGKKRFSSWERTPPTVEVCLEGGRPDCRSVAQGKGKTAVAADHDDVRCDQSIVPRSACGVIDGILNSLL